MKEQRLIHLFTPALLRGLSILTDLAARQPVPSADSVIEEMTALIRDAISEGKAAGRSDSDLEQAAYAVVAFIDDMFPRFPEWWCGNEPLQYRLYKTRIAGDHFFDRLERLSERDTELRELCLMIMGLGFRGRLHENMPRNLALENRRKAVNHADALARRLSPEPLPLKRLLDGKDGGEKLTPQPYTVPAAPPVQVPKEFPWKILGGIAAAVLLVAGGVAAWMLAPTPVPKPEVTVSPVAVAERILAGLPCSRLSVAATADGAGVALSGRYADDAELRARIDAIRAEGIASVDQQGVRQMVRPFCDVIDILEASTSTEVAPAISLSSPNGRYPIGDALYMDIRMTEAFGGTLTVLYVHPSYIVPLLPSAIHPDDRLQRGQTIRIGRPVEEITDKVHGWQVVGPPGPGMIVAIASPAPLFDSRFTPIGIADTLQRLREGLAAPGNSSNPTAVRSNHLEITVVDAQAGGLTGGGR
ncbi:MAG: hypothetical protein RLY86_42 [Pseudomonadota bacterium]|jgi:type IV/VI secretion system ImpK/VasF family protein